MHHDAPRLCCKYPEQSKFAQQHKIYSSHFRSRFFIQFFHISHILPKLSHVSNGKNKQHPVIQELAIERAHCLLIYLPKMVIFHSKLSPTPGDYGLMLSAMLVQAELIKESQQPLPCLCGCVKTPC